MPRKKPRSRSLDDLGNDIVVDIEGARRFDRLTIPNEGIYEGQVLDRKRDGKGRMLSKTGFIEYDGTWANDMRNGYGISKFQGTGDRHEGNYVNNKREGPGIFLWAANGNKYSGNFRNNRMHGNGRLEWGSCGDIYIGNWNLGSITGEGVMYKADGGKWSGSFKDGKLHGWAKQTWSDGCYYDGSFQHGQIHDYGKYLFDCGDSYEGSFKNGEFEGIGVLNTVADVSEGGSTCLGEFCRGERNGLVQIHDHETNTRFYGELTAVEQSDSPVELNPFAGATSATTSSWGRIEYPSGLVYEGQVKNTIRHGHGMLSYTFTEEDRAPDIEFAINMLNVEYDVDEVLRLWGGKFIGRFVDDEIITDSVTRSMLILGDGQSFDIG
jgi:hypothetical protein